MLDDLHEAYRHIDQSCECGRSLNQAVCAECDWSYEWCDCTGQLHLECVCGQDWVIDGEDEEDEVVTTVVTTKPDCKCPNTGVLKLYCEKCGVARWRTTDPWESSPNGDKFAKGQKWSGSWDDDDGWGSVYGGGKSTYVAKDRHLLQEVELPGGTFVYGTSDNQRKNDTPLADLSVMAHQQRSDSLQWYIPWMDYGLPKIDWKMAVGVIADAVEYARAGNIVEFGCMGGHGRTGTMLAVCALLTGVERDEVVAWVREKYCKHAIEGEKQVWWVEEWVPAYLAGEPLPELPAPTPPKVQSSFSEHVPKVVSTVAKVAAKLASTGGKKK